jgi:hypothetical protein
MKRSLVMFKRTKMSVMCVVLSLVLLVQGPAAAALTVGVPRMMGIITALQASLNAVIVPGTSRGIRRIMNDVLGLNNNAGLIAAIQGLPAAERGILVGHLDVALQGAFAGGARALGLNTIENVINNDLNLQAIFTGGIGRVPIPPPVGGLIPLAAAVGLPGGGAPPPPPPLVPPPPPPLVPPPLVPPPPPPPVQQPVPPAGMLEGAKDLLLMVIAERLIVFTIKGVIDIHYAKKKNLKEFESIKWEKQSNRE